MMNYTLSYREIHYIFTPFIDSSMSFSKYLTTYMHVCAIRKCLYSLHIRMGYKTLAKAWNIFPYGRINHKITKTI